MKEVNRYMNNYDKIKNELIDVEIYTRVKDYSKNKYTLEKYYNVGKMIIEAQGGEERAKYGDELIKDYSKKLMTDVDKKYSPRNLRYMRKFYIVFKDENWNAMRSNLGWTHYRELLSIENINEIYYYINIELKQNLSYRALHDKIKTNEYERLSKETKLKLATKGKATLIDNVKNPIVIKNKYNTTDISEKILKQLILDNISNFMKELGEGFSFIDSEYKIMLGDNFNYIDILMFNYVYNCFVVIELKVTELKKEHIGQIQVYMNYIDNNLKTINQCNTIGIIICKKDNKYVIEYCSDSRIISNLFISLNIVLPYI